MRGRDDNESSPLSPVLFFWTEEDSKWKDSSYKVRPLLLLDVCTLSEMKWYLTKWAALQRIHSVGGVVFMPLFLRTPRFRSPLIQRFLNQEAVLVYKIWYLGFTVKWASHLLDSNHIRQLSKRWLLTNAFVWIFTNLSFICQKCLILFVKLVSHIIFIVKTVSFACQSTFWRQIIRTSTHFKR